MAFFVAIYAHSDRINMMYSEVAEVTDRVDFSYE
jgi:hypothetical protein